LVVSIFLFWHTYSQDSVEVVPDPSSFGRAHVNPAVSSHAVGEVVGVLVGALVGVVVGANGAAVGVGDGLILDVGLEEGLLLGSLDGT
jgi:uncharacterized membrane protein